MSNSLPPHGPPATLQAPLSVGFSRQEYRSGLPLPSAGHLPDLGIKQYFPYLNHPRTWCWANKIAPLLQGLRLCRLADPKLFTESCLAFPGILSTACVPSLSLPPPALVPPGVALCGMACLAFPGELWGAETNQIKLPTVLLKWNLPKTS